MSTKSEHKNLIFIKGKDIKVGDVYNNKIITYKQQNDFSVDVRFHDNTKTYFLLNSDVAVMRAE